MTEIIFTNGKLEIKTDELCSINYINERVEVKIGTEVPIKK